MNERLTLTINYWMQVILFYSKDSYSPSNPSGWTYRIDTPDHKIYEKENILDYEEYEVGEYLSFRSYPAGEYAREVGGLNVYKSLKNNNLGNDLTNESYWSFYTILETEQSLLWQPIFGDPIEKERILTFEKTNVFNMLQTLAEKFQVQISFEYEHDDFYRIVSKVVVITQDIEEDPTFAINYNLNLENISRTKDTNDLVTKLYVEAVDSEFEYDGLLTIQNAPQNISMENFIYNFEYLKSIGMITEDQYLDMIELYSVLHNYNTQYMIGNAFYQVLDKEKFQVEIDLEFIDKQLAAIQEVINTLHAKKLASPLEPQMAVTETDKLFSVLEDTSTDPPTYYVNFASKKGLYPVYEEDFIIKIYPQYGGVS